ncbi:MAG: hypothetical protein WC349_04530 [Patescibacteria group bacterium]|jgi:ribosomal protein S27AE
MKQEEKEKVIHVLEEKLAKLPCPRCGNQQFSLVDGYTTQSLQNDLKSMVIGGPNIPSVIVVCNRCGFMSQHALGAIGLLPQEKDKNDINSK